MVAWVIRMVIESFSLFAAAAIFFLYTNWKLALCILVISPFVFWIIYLFRNRVAPMHAALREKLAQMNTCAQENISGNRVVKAFAREEYEIEKFDRANTDYAETNKATAMVWLKFFPFVVENLKIGEMASQLSFQRFMEFGYLGDHFSVTRSKAASAFFSSAA